MWSFQELFSKSALFIRRGLDHPDPNSSEAAIWCFISLELLARANLANVNQALLADPSDGNNVLFACGFPSTKSPRSIPSKTVFHRCTVVCPSFTSTEYKDCMVWLNWRNEELHTGALPLAKLTSSEWLPRFYQICSILVGGVEKTLEDLVGSVHYGTAEEMISALADENKEAAFAKIRAAKEKFKALTPSERLELIRDGEGKRLRDYSVMFSGYKLECPACEGPAAVGGDLVRSSPPVDRDGELVQEEIRIPARLRCYACDLRLDGHSLLYAIGQGDQFKREDYLDPKDYYGIEFDPEEFYGSSGMYMNE